jgi:hypothetical protein
MSIDAIIQFASALAEDDDLRAQLERRTAGKDDESALAAVVAFGKSLGFEFTADEVRRVRAAIALEAKRPAGGELSAQALTQVSGGGSAGDKLERVKGAAPRWADVFAKTARTIGH